MRRPWLALLTVMLVACSTVASPAPRPASPATTASTTPVATAGPTPEPTVDAEPLPSTSVFGWWEDTIKYCHPPAFYRLGNVIDGLGACAGFLSATPKVLSVSVGQDIDLHMSVARDGAAPFYPLPDPEDPLVARGWLIHDPATMTYRALSPGATRLVTARPCLTDADSTTPPGPASCPVLEIHVGDIETVCVDLAEDICRGAAAEAILFGLFPYPGQEIAGWVARPSSLVGAYCGELFAEVTFALRNPDGEVSVSIGSYDLDTPGPGQFVVCTY